jgi:hypothetical protein
VDGVRASNAMGIAREKREKREKRSRWSSTDRRMPSGSDADARHRATLGVGPTASAREIREAFVRVAKRAHPDLSRRTGEAEVGAFRAAVEARDALISSARGGASAGGVRGSASASAFAGGARTAGTPQTRTFALVLASPFVACAVAALALPKAEGVGAKYGREATIGRVNGWINAPVNPWLPPDTREPGDGNKGRFWRTGRVSRAG